jgi:nicotinate-nucleotide--dimethylbenzimidazole phosphoribosyltransferase
MNTSDEIALRDLCARVRGPNSAAQAAARTRLERLSRQPGALGALEPLITRLAAITGQVRPEFSAPAVLLAAADHGIVAERVSPQPPGATAQLLHNVLRGGAAINALAASAGARIVAVDAGLASTLPDHPRLRRVAIGPGTRNLAREGAMTRAQAAAALLAGARIVTAEAQAGLDLLLLGELGAGNTTAAACLTSVFTGVAPELTTGRGAGLDEARLPHKRSVVAGALRRARARPADPIGALSELGGFEIGVLAGAAIAAAERRIPVVLDGFTSASAALVAVGLAPDLRHGLLAAHRTAEPGHRVALEFLGLQPLLALDMRLGEGCGAALALPLIQAAMRLMRDMAAPEQPASEDKAPR